MMSRQNETCQAGPWSPAGWAAGWPGADARQQSRGGRAKLKHSHRELGPLLADARATRERRKTETKNRLHAGVPQLPKQGLRGPPRPPAGFGVQKSGLDGPGNGEECTRTSRETAADSTADLDTPSLHLPVPAMQRHVPHQPPASETRKREPEGLASSLASECRQGTSPPPVRRHLPNGQGAPLEPAELGCNPARLTWRAPVGRRGGRLARFVPSISSARRPRPSPERETGPRAPMQEAFPERRG